MNSKKSENLEIFQADHKVGAKFEFSESFYSFESATSEMLRGDKREPLVLGHKDLQIRLPQKKTICPRAV